MIKIKELVYRLRGEYTIEKLQSLGMKVGERFECLNGVILDPSHCWLIDIGNDVTIAPRVHVLCHDASTKKWLGYTKIGRVTIGNNVIIGANSTITHNVPDNTVVAGSPAVVLSSIEEYVEKERCLMEKSPCYGEEYTLRGNVSLKLRMKQKSELSNRRGYIV